MRQYGLRAAQYEFVPVSGDAPLDEAAGEDREAALQKLAGEAQWRIEGLQNGDVDSMTGSRFSFLSNQLHQTCTILIFSNIQDLRHFKLSDFEYSSTFKFDT